MKCANCVYWEDDICHKKGCRVSFNNNICESFINKSILSLSNEGYYEPNSRRINR